MPLLAILYEFELNQQKLSTLIPGRTLTPIIEKDDLIELTILLAGYFDIRVSGDIQTALTIAYAAFFISKKRSPETESEFIEFHANLLYALTLATNARYRTPYINGIARLVNNSRRSELIRELDERQTTDLKLASCCLHRYCPDEKLEKLVNIASIPHKLDLNNPDWQKSLKTDSQLACLETVSHHSKSNSAQQRKNTNRVFITQPGSKKNDNIFVFLPQQLAYYQCPNDQLINDLNQLHASPATASTTDPTLEEHCKAYLDPKVEIYTGNRKAFKLMCLGTLCTWAYTGYKYHSGNTDFTLPEKAACAIMPLATLHQAFKTLTLADFGR
ncbi:hypothetical protein [Endozoicomonas sp. Mp262]|uniref:hypothetical protein n=1 Tax=Endozoicomonas sp. Mp262 TaxID=2919499 RepID=UPI0021DAFF16